MEKNVLDILLQAELPQPQEKQVKIKRLSKSFGEDVILTLQEISYSRVAEIRRLHEDSDSEIHTLLAGVKEPNLKDKGLMEKFHAPTPIEVVKKLFSAGEITDLSREIERLSGFRVSTLEDAKKN